MIYQFTKLHTLLKIIFFLSACVAFAKPLVFMTYNVENLFDAEYDGSEYREFISPDPWSLHDYQQKKKRVVMLLKEVRPVPDFILLQEVENDRVVRDLQQDLKWYRWRITSDNPRTATEVALLSKYPIKDFRAHHVYSLHIPIRHILEVRIRVRNQDLFLLINHWKSKRGAAAYTETFRIRTAKLLRNLMNELQQKGIVIAGGDFNEEPWESSLHTYPAALTDAEDGIIRTVPPQHVIQQDEVVSPWYTLREEGSYYFRGSPQAIDGFLLSKSVFREWCIKDFFPWKESRASDHFPVILILDDICETQ